MLTKKVPLRSKVKPNMIYMKAQDIGLNIITSKTQGWKKGLTNKSLAEAIKGNKIKFTFTDNMFDEEEVIGLIEENLIQLKDCYSTVDDSIFRKLRSGISNIHSPT